MLPCKTYSTSNTLRMNPLELSIDLSSVPERKQPEGKPKFLLSQDSSCSPNEYILEIDNSNLTLFSDCPRSAFYKLIYNRSPWPSSAIHYGSAIHAGLETWYAAKHFGAPDADQLALMTAFIYFGRNGPISESEWRNEDQLALTLTKYFAKYSTEPFSLFLSDDGTPALEQAFRYQLGTIPIDDYLKLPSHDLFDTASADPLFVSKLHIVWTGRIDMIIEQAGKLFVLDHKTTSIAGPSYWESFRLSQQFIGYKWVTQQLLKRPVEGACLNGIIARQPTKTGRSVEFDRMFYFYSDEHCAEWLHDVLAQIETFVAYMRTGFFPKRTSQCVAKFGTCAYLPVCSAPDSSRLHMLTSDEYTTNVWSPLQSEPNNPTNTPNADQQAPIQSTPSPSAGPL